MPIVIMFVLLFSQPSGAALFDLAPRDVPYFASDTAFTGQSGQHLLSEYRGHKVMLWLFSTWCHTCVAGIKVMQDNQVFWKQSGLIILAVRNRNNGGYPGLKMPDFIKKIAPQLLQEPNWVTGEASAEMAQQYNARQFPDIYYLIDEQGRVQTVSTAPTATLQKIKQFAGGISQ